MREYYVMKSKYKENGHYINVLTYSPRTTLLKSHDGIYRYYHLGKLIWEKLGDDKLFSDVSDGTFYDIFSYDDQLRRYPIYLEYSKSCCPDYPYDKVI